MFAGDAQVVCFLGAPLFLPVRTLASRRARACRLLFALAANLPGCDECRRVRYRPAPYLW